MPDDIHIDIDTTAGPVRGRRLATHDAWLGIPFAAPPAGPLRWHPPRPHPGWREPLAALRPAPAAAQHVSQMAGDLPGGLDGCTENCLTLNVFSPGHAVNAPGGLPVMVWIHGGGFAIGGASQGVYHGGRLAHDGNVVVVTIAYRLGAFGFLRLCDVTDGAIPATGNEGLLDQIAALRWVRDNIAAFGGDPDRVTVFGESAGAMSIATLLTMPRARGLAQRAILQSGSASAVHEPARANKVARLFLELLPDEARRDPARADAAALVAAQRIIHGRMMFDERLTVMPMRPVADGDLVPDVPLAAMQAGDAARIPVIAGYNRDEWRYYALVDRGLRHLDDGGMRRRLAYHFDERQIASILEAARYDPRAPDDPFRVCCEVIGDLAFRVPTERAIAALAPSQPVFAYRFDQPCPAMGGRLGACHFAEVAYPFGTLDAPGADTLFARDADAWAVAQAMLGAWSAFADRGDPGGDSWPPASAGPGVYRFAAECGFMPPPANDLDAFWSGIPDAFLLNQ
jgi:para-nitrobenzyl esterase